MEVTMKTKSILFICIIGLILACGLVLLGCGSKCDNDGNCVYVYGGAKSLCSSSDCASVVRDKTGSGLSGGCSCD